MPGKKLDISVGTAGPALLVSFSTARLSLVGKKGAELLLFEFKTEPVKPVDGKKKK